MRFRHLCDARESLDAEHLIKRYSGTVRSMIL
jgi:hypothetical protein